MTPFVASRNNEKTVIQGRAIVIDVPPIDCYPSPVVQWYEGSSNTPIQRDSLYRHITLKNQLVLLETKAADNRKTFKAVATNGYTQQTSDSHIFRLTVHRGELSRVLSMVLYNTHRTVRTLSLNQLLFMFSWIQIWIMISYLNTPYKFAEKLKKTTNLKKQLPIKYWFPKGQLLEIKGWLLANIGFEHNTCIYSNWSVTTETLLISCTTLYYRI